MADQIVLHSAFDPASIQFQPIGKTAKGGKIVYINFAENKRIKLQTPVMSAPFGISTFDEASTGTQTFSLDASFNGYQTDPKIAGFLEKCKALDEHVLATAVTRSKEWFGKAMERDVIANFLRPTVKEASDPTKWAPTIKFKIAMRNGAPSTEFYDEFQNDVDMTYITKGTTFRAIIELSSIWFINKTFGCTWRLAQVAVASRPDKLSGFAFKMEEDE